jgi:DNA/RNA-binding domain of Phe-tRNA-synthetase-like protein
VTHEKEVFILITVTTTDTWKQAFPGASIGLLLVSGIDNSGSSRRLDERKKAIVTEVRARFAGYSREDLLRLDVLNAYRSYYKKFNKTYHVQLQLESVLLKGKSLPTINPLVDSNFAAELKTLILTAGHDADRLEPPISIDTSDGSESFVQMNGEAKKIKPDDMKMVDGGGVSCTIIYGQDNRSPISPRTTRALFVSYAPVGVTPEAVSGHLDLVKSHIELFAPDAKFEYLEVRTA